MGSDAFQEAKLRHLEFEKEFSNSQRGIPLSHVAELPLPDELPDRADLTHLPKDILKSSTVENLISQNEDLMARLKVALRRLSILENENNVLTEENSKSRLAQTTFSDQLLVWKEKDSRWKQKVDIIERDKEIHQEKAKVLQLKVDSLSVELARHEKYHERIKTQVKPYITQLKEYSQTQEIKIKELEENLTKKEAQVRDIRHQIVEITKNYHLQIESTEKKSQEIIQYYEEQITSFTKELEVLRANQKDYDLQSVKLNSALEKQDTLENEIITLKRSKDDLKDRLMKEIKQIQDRQSELTRQNQKLGVEHADLQIRVMEDQELIKRLEMENRQQFEQLESLRFMWNSKNEETEKLKMATTALEKLNLELSQKLNELRK